MKGTGQKRLRLALAAVLVTVLATGIVFAVLRSRNGRAHTAMGFAMDTVVTQTVYGPRAEAAARAVNQRLAQLEDELSLYRPSSEIAALNAAAGGGPVAVSQGSLQLLQRALTLEAGLQGAFQLTVAPLTQLWNITGEEPHLPTQQEIDALLPLVDDGCLQLDGSHGTARLAKKGQAVDMGGIAKGYACDQARLVYLENGVRHALLSIGGNICAVGGRPDGQPFRIGFRDPNGGESSYIASFLLRDGVVAVSGGYERYFEKDGVRYHHILDPHTGFPAQSDIVSVGVVCDEGAAADLWSTALFCLGRDWALDWMRSADAAVLLLDNTGTLYVSAALQEGFLAEDPALPVVFVEGGHATLDG